MIYRMPNMHQDANDQDPTWVTFREDYPTYTWADIVEYFDINE